MPLDGWLVLSILATAMLGMVSNRVAPDLALAGALGLMILLGLVESGSALAGFANEGMLSVALLFVLAEGLRRSGALRAATDRLLGGAGSPLRAQARLLPAVAGLSAFCNNTPVVASLLPSLRSWARARGIAPSLLFIPLSYAAILGGMCTLIGTSSNLLVHGLLLEGDGPRLGLFTISLVGVPAALVAMAFLLLVGRRLLPDRGERDDAFADPRTFTSEFVVEAGGPLVGARLGDVRVGELRGLHPVEIDRDGSVLPAPREHELLHAGDRLVFSGPAAATLHLRAVPGMQASEEHEFLRDGDAGSRELLELVVGERCPLIGRPVGDGSFRRQYNAAVLAVARHGERLSPGGLGAWTLRPGDAVLIDAPQDFREQHRGNPDFHVITPRSHEQPPPAWQAPLTLAIALAMVLVAGTGVGGYGLFEAALAAALLLVVTRVLRWRDARGAVDWRIVLTIAAGIGIGRALQDSGAATAIAQGLVALGGAHPWSTLALLYLATAISTELITNNAAAVLVLPIALSSAERLEVAALPFVIAVMIAASASFATPIGYQTNLMVYGAGGYRFSDFLRIGIPTGLLVGAVVVLLTPFVYPF